MVARALAVVACVVVAMNEKKRDVKLVLVADPVWCRLRDADGKMGDAGALGVGVGDGSTSSRPLLGPPPDRLSLVSN